MNDTEIYANFVNDQICNELPDEDQKERLQTLANFLYQLLENKFEINSVVEEFDYKFNCGTVCCAVGWTPALFPDLVKWPYHGRGVRLRHTGEAGIYSIAESLFGLPVYVSMRLFNTANATGAFDAQPNDATPEQVADSITNYLEFVKTL